MPRKKSNFGRSKIKARFKRIYSSRFGVKDPYNSARQLAHDYKKRGKSVPEFKNPEARVSWWGKEISKKKVKVASNKAAKAKSIASVHESPEAFNAIVGKGVDKSDVLELTVYGAKTGGIYQNGKTEIKAVFAKGKKGEVELKGLITRNDDGDISFRRFDQKKSLGKSFDDFKAKNKNGAFIIEGRTKRGTYASPESYFAKKDLIDKARVTTTATKPKSYKDRSKDSLRPERGEFYSSTTQAGSAEQVRFLKDQVVAKQVSGGKNLIRDSKGNVVGKGADSGDYNVAEYKAPPVGTERFDNRKRKSVSKPSKAAGRNVGDITTRGVAKSDPGRAKAAEAKAKILAKKEAYAKQLKKGPLIDVKRAGSNKQVRKADLKVGDRNRRYEIWDGNKFVDEIIYKNRVKARANTPNPLVKPKKKRILTSKGDRSSYKTKILTKDLASGDRFKSFVGGKKISLQEALKYNPSDVEFVEGFGWVKKSGAKRR